MAGMTGDGKVYRYGVPEQSQLVAWGLGANQTVYNGEVALVSGSGATTTGFLKNAATYGSADLVAGMIGDPSGGTYVKTGPGIVGTAVDGAVQIDVMTGAFFFQSGTGADALTAANNGKTVYYGGENSTGPIAVVTSAGRPVLGIQLPQDPGIAGGFSPGANYWPVKLNVVGGP